MKKLIAWFKQEVVLGIALLLAIVSAFVIPPDREYIDYIDFRTLAILLCLMAVMAGLQKIGLFRYVAERLLKQVKHIRALMLILIMLCFFSSMIITNDVALITFVPFTFIVLKMVLGEQAEKQIVPIVVMQTIAANLGSMLTPIGNPQNLYLYGKASLNFGEFILFMLPYTVVAFVLLALWCLLVPYKEEKKISFRLEEQTSLKESKMQLVLYLLLFMVCILTVVHLIPYGVMLVVVVAIVSMMDKTVLKNVDYGLLFTFIGFFIFIGNMGRIPVFNHFIKQIIDGNEIMTSVVASQFMSNVPAALLLSGFTTEYRLLIVGTNLGGLGTLIASMASLISFKYMGKEYSHLKGKYIIYFTIANILFLIILFISTLY